MKQKRPLTRFETLAQRLVEGSFKRLFGEQLAPQEIAARLARAMEDSHHDGLAADVYHVAVNPDDFKLLIEKFPDLSAELSHYLNQLAQQTNLTFASQPQIALTADSALARHRVRVRAEHGNRQADAPTQIHPRMDIEQEKIRAIQAVDAYLIVAGRQHVSLDRPLITIGRHTDNDIVLDSATVSRRHAQIRWRYGRFILTNLSQRGRTKVNEQSITEHLLQPGDVLALNKILIIYGEGRDEKFDGPAADDGGLTLQLPKQ